MIFDHVELFGEPDEIHHDPPNILIELFDKEKLAAQKETAEKELTSFRTLRVGKEAPDIAGADLNGKEFKLSDYRGKVVLLDFWGHW